MVPIGEALSRNILSVRNNQGPSANFAKKCRRFKSIVPQQTDFSMGEVCTDLKALLMLGFSHNFKQKLYVPNFFTSQVMKNNTLLI